MIVKTLCIKIKNWILFLPKVSIRLYHCNVIALHFFHRKFTNLRTLEVKKSEAKVFAFLNAPISKFYYDVVSKKCTIIWNFPFSSFLWPKGFLVYFILHRLLQLDFLKYAENCINFKMFLENCEIYQFKIWTQIVNLVPRSWSKSRREFLTSQFLLKTII